MKVRYAHVTADWESEKLTMVEFLPQESIRQPAWASELMREYWHKVK